MLDTSITLLSIQTKASSQQENIDKQLLLHGCNVYGYNKFRVYSEMDQATINMLNRNDYSLGSLEIELVIKNGVTKERYPNFYTKCFVIRTDTGLLIKPMKFSNKRTYSKIDHEGNLIVSVGYYFRSKEQLNEIKECKLMLVEGFIALASPKNVYGIKCQIRKDKNDWVFDHAHTYKPRHAKNIKYLID